MDSYKKKLKIFKTIFGVASIIFFLIASLSFAFLKPKQIIILIIHIILLIISLITYMVLCKIPAQKQIKQKKERTIKKKQNTNIKQKIREEEKIVQVKANTDEKYIQTFVEKLQIRDEHTQRNVINQYNQITMNEYVESTFAKQLYNDKKKQTLWVLFLPLIPLSIFFVLFYIRIGTIDMHILMSSVAYVFLMLSFGGAILCPILRNAYLSKYKIIYLTAKKNDEVRYNEKIRFMERKRLEEQYDNKNNDENILKTINGLGESVED